MKQRLRSGGAIPASEVDKTAHAILNDVNGGKGEPCSLRSFLILTLLRTDVACAAFSQFDFQAYFGSVLAGPQKGEYWSLQWLHQLVGLKWQPPREQPRGFNFFQRHVDNAVRAGLGGGSPSDNDDDI